MTINQDNRVTWLFSRFSADFGAKWTKPLNDDRSIELAFTEWGGAIKALTPEQVRHGADAAKASPDEWPPSIATFLRLALGLPEIYVAAANACRMSDDPLSKEIRQRAGSHLVRTASSRDAMRMCEAAYRDVLLEFNQTVLAGKPVDPVVYLEGKKQERIEHSRSSPGTGVSLVNDSIPQHLMGV